MRRPDFEQIKSVFAGQVPDRPVLYESALNGRLIERFADPDLEPGWGQDPANPYLATAWRNIGFDYMMAGGGWSLTKGERHKEKTVSLNEGALITERRCFEAYEWTEPRESDFTYLREARLPEGMKMISRTPGGVLENVIGLVGFERLCYLTVDDPELVEEVFEAVRSRLVRYCELCASIENVGACCVNDDWGFKTQTMLPPPMMRRYVFPWHAEAVRAIHAAGKPAMLHSCGNLAAVMDDVIDGMGYDAGHSYEDAILPVEDACERWHERIAILGGIDVDFLCRSTPGQVRARSAAMLERAEGRGAYALGSGNSVPEYVPDENFPAMASAAVH